MINFIETNNKEEIERIVKNPIISKLLSLSDSYEPDFNNEKFYLIHKESLVIGITTLKKFSNITYDAHLILLPEYHGRGLATKVGYKFFKFVKKNTIINNLITSVPLEAKHGHKYMERLEFKVIGLIKNGIVYNNKIQDLILYQKEV